MSEKLVSIPFNTKRIKSCYYIEQPIGDNTVKVCKIRGNFSSKNLEVSKSNLETLPLKKSARITNRSKFFSIRQEVIKKTNTNDSSEFVWTNKFFCQNEDGYFLDGYNENIISQKKKKYQLRKLYFFDKSVNFDSVDISGIDVVRLSHQQKSEEIGDKLHKLKHLLIWNDNIGSLKKYPKFIEIILGDVIGTTILIKTK